ncbi:MAG: serine O-acetyltransferase [Bacteroidetes bacterium]|nr:serine O-acetyltransferase [Bacteroidota bacterium]
MKEFYKIMKIDIEKDLCREPSFFNILRYVLFNNSYQVVFLFRLCANISKLWYLKPLLIFLDYVRVAISSCYISNKATIDSGLYLPHATGIVIGSGASIGMNCTIYQNVTIGRKNVNSAEYPTIGNNVTVCAGACLIGGIYIGNNSVVGANSVVLCNVPDNCTAVGVPAKIILN